jgi:hypothetical protein
MARHWWLTPVILAAWDTEFRRIKIQSQPREVVCNTLSQKYPTQKGLAGWLEW